MSVYDGFAGVYATGDYPEYSRKVAELLPDTLGNLGLRPRTVLDLACGEGTFAVEVAKLGYDVTGYDRSEKMLARARTNANCEEVEVKFQQGDMRNIPFREGFDLVTCWYDSINYMLTEEDLEKTFSGAARALKDGGAFIFDMNTIYALAVQWQERGCYVQRSDEDIFEVHQTEFDRTKEIATLNVMAFAKEEDCWRKVSETHRERAYPLEKVEELLHSSGFEEVSVFGDPSTLTEVERKSGRAWFVARKSSRSSNR
ncbi:MAG: class I SAM-dependent DNA methyltransferase [Candidatus Bipolaricaulota bacterium]